MFVSTLFLSAQNTDSKIQRDSIFDLSLDTIENKSIQVSNQKILAKEKKQWTHPDPMKVVWMGAVIPGYGQIMNRKYWKLPIVYGGFMGCAYAINWNSNRYQSYKQAYLDITDTNEATNSFLVFQNFRS